MPQPARAADLRGSFKVTCPWTHTLPEDPIVFPGQPGASHLHDFFGNVTTSANSTRETLLLGSTTCGDWDDTAGYWSPAGYLSGVQITPLLQRIYYFGAANLSVETIPADLKMIAGNKNAASAADNPHVSWNCGGSENTPNTPLSTHPYDCRQYQGTMPVVDGVVGWVDFPECWDGVHLDSTDHISHMAYKEGGGCPAGFPHMIPQLRLRVHFGIWDPCNGATPCGPTDPDSNVKLTLSSGAYYTLHADFWNTWKQGALDDLVKNCLDAHVQCGAPKALSPSSPTLSTSAGSGIVHLSWTPPSSGSGITNYNIYRSTASGGETLRATVGNVSSYDDTAVTDGVTYYYVVRAVNSYGTGLPSNEVAATPQPPTVPGAPTLSAMAGNGSAHLSWNAPLDGGSPITNYKIYRGTTSGGEILITSVGSVTTYDDGGLINGTTYYYQVSAVNAVGEGSRSSEVSVTPQSSGVPGAPILTTTSASGKGVVVSWTVPSSGGGAITGYRIYRGTLSGGERFLVAVGSVTSYKDTATQRGTTYYYEVTAVNASGEGPLSNEASAKAT